MKRSAYGLALVALMLLLFANGTLGLRHGRMSLPLLGILVAWILFFFFFFGAVVISQQMLAVLQQNKLSNSSATWLITKYLRIEKDSLPGMRKVQSQVVWIIAWTLPHFVAIFGCLLGLICATAAWQNRIR